MTNVKTLPGVKLADEVNEDVVRICGRLLDAAKCGQLQSIVAVGVGEKQVLDAVALGGQNIYAVVGALEIMALKVKLSTIESETYEK